MYKWQFNSSWNGPGHWHLVDDFTFRDVPAERVERENVVEVWHDQKCYPRTTDKWGYPQYDYTRVECKCRLNTTEPKVNAGTYRVIYDRPAYTVAAPAKPLCGQAGGSVSSTGGVMSINDIPYMSGARKKKMVGKTWTVRYVVQPPQVFEGELPPGSACTYCVRKVMKDA